MRTDLRIVLGAIVAGLVSAPVVAADVEFDPRLTVRIFKDGNVRGVGDRQPSDTVGSVGLSLAWSVRNPASSFTFAYRPYREIYNDATRPDFTGHSLGGSYSKTFSERTSIAYGFDYSRSDRQELDPTRESEALTYLPRRTFQSGGASVNGSFAAGRRSSLSWRVGARTNRGEDLREKTADDGTIIPASNYENSESYDGALGWSLGYSPQGSAGLSVSAQHFAYEVRPSVDVISVGHTGSRRFSREGAFNYNVGVLQSKQDSMTNTSASLSLGASWRTGPGTSFAVGASQSASAGDGQSGATLDRGVYASWSYSRPRGFGASMSVGYWDRSDLGDTAGSSALPSALSVSDGVSWPVGRFFRLGAFHSYRRQSVPAGDTSGLATSYNNFGLAVTWIMRGEPRGRG